jgi:F-type H+-transporting ATPase subunit epsilon
MENALLSFKILCPERDFFEGEAKEVIFSTPDGSIGIMAGHAPMFAAVSEGVLKILLNSEWKTAAVGQGFCELSYYRAEFYLDSAEWAEEIDVARAREALERAEHRMHSTLSRQEYIRTQASMSRALARLKAAKFSGGGYFEDN